MDDDDIKKTGQPRYYARVMHRSFVEPLLELHVQEQGALRRLTHMGIDNVGAYFDYADEHAKRRRCEVAYFAVYPIAAAREVGMRVEDIRNQDPVGFARVVLGDDMPGSIGLPHEPRVMRIDELFIIKLHRKRGGFQALAQAMKSYATSNNVFYVYGKVTAKSLRGHWRRMGLRDCPIMYGLVKEIRVDEVPLDYGDESKDPRKMEKGSVDIRNPWLTRLR